MMLSLRGSDAARYLNGQITNAVPPLAPGATVLACVTNHKGKLDAAPVFVHRIAPQAGEADTFLIESPVPLFDRLDRYLIADDCELEEADGRFVCVHLLDDGFDRPAAAVHDAPSLRYGAPGRDIIFPVGQVPDGLPVPSPGRLESLRVWHQVPAWGSELSEDTLPPEIPFFREHAISYVKGCYIGQEVISRIKSAGKVPRELRLLVPEGGGGERLEPGMALVAGDDPETEVGTLTSVATHPDAPESPIALGYVRRAFSETGRLLNARSAKKVLPVALRIREAPGATPDPSAR